MVAIIRIIDGLNEFVGRLAGWLAVLLVLNVVLVVTLRYVFSIGFVWLQELYVWTHAAIFLAGAGYTLLHDGHVRIDLFYGRASERYKALANVFGCVFLAGPLLYVLFDKSWPIVVRSWMSLERSAEVGGLPGLYLLKSAILVFCILMGLQVVSMLLRNLSILVTGRDLSDPTSIDGTADGKAER